MAPAKRLEDACRAHWEMLETFARRLLRGREAEADDFIQEAMTRFVEKFQEGEVPAPRRIASWLMATLTNHLISDWRKRVVRQRAQADPGLRLVVGPQPPEDIEAPPPRTTLMVVLEEVTDEAFRAAVDSLSPKLREAYRLHAAGLCHTDIARRLGINENAVAQRLFKARRRLRGVLAASIRGEKS